MSAHIYHSQSHPSPYNFDRNISPTLASITLLSPNGGPPHQSHGSQVTHGVHRHSPIRHSPIKMNGNISSRTINVSPMKANFSLNSNSKQPLVDISRTTSNPQTSPHLNGSRVDRHSPQNISYENPNSDSIVDEYGLQEMLASLALMCLLSLLMAFLALFFLQKTCYISGLTDESNEEMNSKVNKNHLNQMRIVSNNKEYVRVFQISVSLSTLTISLDLCCLFVCCIQFLSAVKLMKTQFGRKRTFEFLKKTSHIRVVAIGAFLISIPIFFTGVILFTFVNFDEVPALATSLIIGIGIVFCGIASVQTVYLWQWEKTKASRELSESRIIHLRDSGFLPTIELSTLV